jgi:TolB-like protein/Tfp pilus assembly protein PilF
VVPFRDTSSDSAYAQVSIAIADDLITELGSIGNIAIRPTSSILKYAGRPIDPVATGHEQKVDAVLVGTIAGSDGRMRVAAQLLKTNGSLLWSGTFDKPSDQIFNLEREMEDSVAQALHPEKVAVHAPMSQAPDPEAYRAYLEGRYFGNKRSEGGLRKSVEYFQKATIKDPRFALAYAGLADAYTDLAISNLEPAQQAYAKAQAAAVKALELDSTLAEPHAALAKVFLGYERNWARADDEYKRAIQLNPNYSIGHLRYASYLAASGRLDLALIEASRAQELDPVSLGANSALARIYYLSRRYDQAVAAFHHTIELDPNYAGAHLRLGMVYAAQKDYSDAVRELTEAKRLFPRDNEADGLLAYVCALEGNKAASYRILEDLKRRSNREYVSKYAVSLVYLGLGEQTEAIDWLTKAAEEDSPGLNFLGVDPVFDSVRSDSRFVTLLTKLGLPQFQAENVRPGLNNRPF